MATIKLFESWLQSQAINEFAPHDQIDLSVLQKVMGVDGWAKESDLASDNNLRYEKIKNILIRNGIKFSVEAPEAALIITNYMLLLIKWNNQPVDPSAWIKKTSDIQLMDSPEDPTKILTTGLFTKDAILDPGNDSASSSYEDIALYCNNKTLVEMAGRVWYNRYYNNYGGWDSGYGYNLSTAGETGTVTWVGSSDNKFVLYGTAATTSAASKQVATTTTWEVPTTGKTIVKKFPGTMFATGQITLADSKALDAAIAELQTLKADGNTIITNIEIESSASGDKPVDGVNGYPPNTPAGKYPFGTPYVVKPTDTSANAKLAKGRGDTIKAKLASLAPTITVKAVIQDGLEEAQYAKITVTINKKDKPSETFTKTDLETILLKPKQTTNLASTKKLSQWKGIVKPV
jgi:hypothetical protein